MPGIKYEINRRQFYIGAGTKRVSATTDHAELNNGYTLSYCKSLPVVQVEASGKMIWTLVGDAIQSLPGRPSPEVSLKDVNTFDELDEVTASWAGRWLLIGGDEIYQDAVGLLGCFYRINSDGSVEMASSANLLAENQKPETYLLLKGHGIEFYPLPDTGFHNIKKFYPSQIFNMRSGAVRLRNLLCKVEHGSYSDIIDQVSTILTTTVSNAYTKLNKNIVLALTAGYDSRTLMAVLNNVKLPYEAITFNSPVTNPMDVRIPSQLCRKFGIKHRVINRKRLKLANGEKYNKHSSYHAVERDREAMMYQQFDVLDAERSLLLRANCFEVGRCAYYRWLPPQFSGADDMVRILKGNAQQAASFAKWYSWVEQTLTIELDWRDRYYWEQRMPGWLCATEQGLDVVNVERLVPANCRLLYTLLLSIPVDVRRTKVHHLDIIRKLSPELLEIPLNPKPGFFEKQIRRVSFKIEKLRNTKVYQRIMSV